MKKLLLIFAIFYSALGFAQKDKAAVDTMVAQFTQSLEDRGVLNYFSTTRYCDGNIEMIQMPNGRLCASKGTFYEVYVFWQEESKNYGKKIDNCGIFASIELTNGSVYEYFMDHVSDFEKNPVKPYSISKKESGPVVGQGTEIHNCHHAFTFKDFDDKFSQSYNLFDLTNDAEEANINYEYNKGLTLVTLDMMLDEAIIAIEESPNFIRI